MARFGQPRAMHGELAALVLDIGLRAQEPGALKRAFELPRAQSVIVHVELFRDLGSGQMKRIGVGVEETILHLLRAPYRLVPRPCRDESPGRQVHAVGLFRVEQRVAHYAVLAHDRPAAPFDRMRRHLPVRGVHLELRHVPLARVSLLGRMHLLLVGRHDEIVEELVRCLELPAFAVADGIDIVVVAQKRQVDAGQYQRLLSFGIDYVFGRHEAQIAFELQARDETGLELEVDGHGLYVERVSRIRDVLPFEEHRIAVRQDLASDSGHDGRVEAVNVQDDTLPDVAPFEIGVDVGESSLVAWPDLRVVVAHRKGAPEPLLASYRLLVLGDGVRSRRDPGRALVDQLAQGARHDPDICRYVVYLLLRENVIGIAMPRVVYLELRVLFLEAERARNLRDRQADDLQRIAELDIVPAPETELDRVELVHVADQRREPVGRLLSVAGDPFPSRCKQMRYYELPVEFQVVEVNASVRGALAPFHEPFDGGSGRYIVGFQGAGSPRPNSRLGQVVCRRFEIGREVLHIIAQPICRGCSPSCRRGLPAHRCTRCSKARLRTRRTP